MPGVQYPLAQLVPLMPAKADRAGKAITTAELAAICGKSPEAIRKALRRAGIKSILTRVSGGCWRTLWHEPAALACLAQTKQESNHHEH